jgi:hypothetical protein
MPLSKLAMAGGRKILFWSTKITVVWVMAAVAASGGLTARRWHERKFGRVAPGPPDRKRPWTDKR